MNGVSWRKRRKIFLGSLQNILKSDYIQSSVTRNLDTNLEPFLQKCVTENCLFYPRDFFPKITFDTMFRCELPTFLNAHKKATFWVVLSDSSSFGIHSDSNDPKCRDFFETISNIFDALSLITYIRMFTNHIS